MQGSSSVWETKLQAHFLVFVFSKRKKNCAVAHNSGIIEVGFEQKHVTATTSRNKNSRRVHLKTIQRELRENRPFWSCCRAARRIQSRWMQLYNHPDRSGPGLFLLGLVPSLLSTGGNHNSSVSCYFLSMEHQHKSTKLSINLSSGLYSAFVFAVFLLPCTTKYV